MKNWLVQFICRSTSDLRNQYAPPTPVHGWGSVVTQASCAVDLVVNEEKGRHLVVRLSSLLVNVKLMLLNFLTV